MPRANTPGRTCGTRWPWASAASCFLPSTPKLPPAAITWPSICTPWAANLRPRKQPPEALRLLQDALPGQEVARFHAAPSGFHRAIVADPRAISPQVMLALGLARPQQPVEAFRHAEASLARGLL